MMYLQEASTQEPMHTAEVLLKKATIVYSLDEERQQWAAQHTLGSTAPSESCICCKRLPCQPRVQCRKSCLEVMTAHR